MVETTERRWRFKGPEMEGRGGAMVRGHPELGQAGIGLEVRLVKPGLA
jgi:hypothetical protein